MVEIGIRSGEKSRRDPDIDEDAFIMREMNLSPLSPRGGKRTSDPQKTTVSAQTLLRRIRRGRINDVPRTVVETGVVARSAEQRGGQGSPQVDEFFAQATNDEVPFAKGGL